LSAMVISLRPHSARERSATWKSGWCVDVVLLAGTALIAPPFSTSKRFASAVVDPEPGEHHRAPVATLLGDRPILPQDPASCLAGLASEGDTPVTELKYPAARGVVVSPSEGPGLASPPANRREPSERGGNDAPRTSAGRRHEHFTSRDDSADHTLEHAMDACLVPRSASRVAAGATSDATWLRLPAAGMVGRADLHVHSLWSDGMQSPEAIVRAA